MDLLLIGIIILSTPLHAQWSLTGNAISPGNFLGTTNASNLVFHTNSINSGLLDIINGNSFFGLGSGGNSSSSAFQNTAFGSNALKNNSTGNKNVAIGGLSLYFSSSGNLNTALGLESLYKNTAGNNNTAVGALSLYSNNLGSDNSSFGSNCSEYSTSASSNSVFGSNALQNNTLGSNITAIGYQAAYSDTASRVTAIGYQALFTNVYGYINLANGYQALYSNTTGYANTAVGYKALFATTVGTLNTAVGAQALGSEQYCYGNTAVGYQALFANTGALNLNTAVGTQSLLNNNGSGNTAFGYQALYNNTSASSNTGVGDFALINNITGTANVGFGSNAGPSIGNLVYTVAIGAGSTPTSSYEIVIGTPATTSIGGYANWSNLSDNRFKKNIKENVPGLEFINQLRPVTYVIDAFALDKFIHSTSSQNQKRSSSIEYDSALKEKGNIIYSGFIAQEVEKAADKLNYDFSGLVKPQNSNDLYSLRYDDFIPSLIVSVKQLDSSNSRVSNIINDLKGQVDSLQTELEQLIKDGDTESPDVPMLWQNKPNPFYTSTIISYYVPAKSKSAVLKITNANGQSLKVFNLKCAGYGEVTFYVNNISSDIYFYTLVVDGKTISTKKMILRK